MNWDLRLFNELAKIVRRKYNEEFWGKQEAWADYLKSVGIERIPAVLPKRTVGDDGDIMIECPHRLKSQPNMYLEQSLEIPRELAEKIVVLGVMP